jgi:hypothetical protein
LDLQLPYPSLVALQYKFLEKIVLKQGLNEMVSSQPALYAVMSRHARRAASASAPSLRPEDAHCPRPAQLP